MYVLIGFSQRRCLRRDSDAEHEVDEELAWEASSV